MNKDNSDMKLLENVNKCMADSEDTLSNDNILLKEEGIIANAFAASSLPAIFVNGKYMSGSVSKVDLFDEICLSLEDAPS